MGLALNNVITLKAFDFHPIMTISVSYSYASNSDVEPIVVYFINKSNIL